MEYELKKWKVDTSDFGKKSIGTMLKESVGNDSTELICGLLEIIVEKSLPPIVKPAINTVIGIMKNIK